MHKLHTHTNLNTGKVRYFVNGFEVDSITYMFAESQNLRFVAIRRGAEMKQAARKRERQTR